jgi:hypothetical protein
MSEPPEASHDVSGKVAKVSGGGCEPGCASDEFERYALRGALYFPPEPGLPYLAIVLNAQNEVLSARSVPSAEAGKNLVAKVSAAFASARSSGNSSKCK